MTQETNISSKTRLIPLTDWPKYHPYPTLGGLRHLVFHAKTNGFFKVIRRVGSRILLDESAWFDFVNSRNPQAKEASHE